MNYISTPNVQHKNYILSTIKIWQCLKWWKWNICLLLTVHCHIVVTAGVLMSQNLGKLDVPRDSTWELYDHSFALFCVGGWLLPRSAEAEADLHSLQRIIRINHICK